MIAIAGLFWTAHVFAADRTPGPCDHPRIVRMTSEPNPPDAACNPMLKATTVPLGGVQWAQ